MAIKRPEFDTRDRSAGRATARAPGSMARLASIVATAGGAGFTPRAPGTAGALVGVAIYFAVVVSGLEFFYLPLLAVITVAGTWAAFRVEEVYGHDSPRIVIDEVAGQMVALAFVERSGSREVGVGMVLGFLLFRFFDILKPFPIRRLENLPGGIGVVTDDLGAGIYALIVLMIVEPWVFGFAADFWNR